MKYESKWNVTIKGSLTLNFSNFKQIVLPDLYKFYAIKMQHNIVVVYSRKYGIL